MVTLTDLQTRLSDLEIHYSALRNRWVQDEQYYEGTFDLAVPKGVNKIVPATGRNAIDVPATHIVTDQPGIHRNRDAHKGIRISRDDDDVEAYYLGFLQVNHQASLIPPLHTSVKFQLMRGMAVHFGPFFNLDKYEKGEDDALYFESLDPLNVLIMPGSTPRGAFVSNVFTIAEMEEKAETDKRFRKFRKDGRKSTDQLVLTEWYGFVPGELNCGYAAWTHDYAQGSTDLILQANYGDWLIEPMDTGYLYLPVDPVLSGYGILSPLPEKQVVSILNEQVKSLLIGEAYALSIMDGYMGVAAFERYSTDSQEAADAMNMDYAPASVSIVPRGVEKIKPSDIPNALLVNYDKIGAALENALFSGVIQGQRPKGVDTASGLAILSGTGRLKFGDPLRFLETGTSRLLYKVGQCIDTPDIAKLGEFTAMGQTIRAGQFHGDYRARVELFSEAPEERNARINTGLQLAGSEMAPSEKHVQEKYFGIENYEEELEQRTYEKLVHSDAMQQTLQQFLQLAQAEPQGQTGVPDAGGINALRGINQMAVNERGMSGMQPQMPPMPGSAGALNQQAQGQAQMGQPTPIPTNGAMGA